MFCRFCQKQLTNTILDLGYSPGSNDYLTRAQLASPEVYFPLVVMFCENCFLVQTLDFHTNSEIFRSDYAYLSSMSESWVKQCEEFSHSISDTLGLTSESFVIEVASNDGYLLKNFVKAGIPCLGIEPTSGPANVAIADQIPTLVEFLTLNNAKAIVEDYRRADLVICNNVYAHVPDILDFTLAIDLLLHPEGVVTLEFPHVVRMVEEGSFDTIYHEHFSYHSLTTVSEIFKSAGLEIWRVEQLHTHGGSLRVYGSKEASKRPIDESVLDLLEVEKEFGVGSSNSYLKLRNHALATKYELNQLLYKLKCDGFSIAAAGAAAKGNTLLNFLGVDSSCIDFVCDSAPSKVGKYLPGSHIPIVPYEELRTADPDYIIILPWNIRDEIIDMCRSNLKRDVKFIVHQPGIEIIE